MTLISKEHKIIVISVPKTGTRSINNALHNRYGFHRNKITINNRELKFAEHATALEVKEIMGNDFDEFVKVAVLRDPRERLASHYNYIKNKKPTRRVSFKNGINKFATSILPFYLWVVFYDYVSNYQFFMDESGESLIDHTLNFNNLETDFYKVFRQTLGLKIIDGQFGHKNIVTNSNKKIKVNESRVRNHEFMRDMAFFKQWKSIGLGNN